MVSLGAASTNGTWAGDFAPGGATRGVVTGKYFTLNPLPPPPDVLGNPLIVPDLPTHKLPKETWRSRMQRRLARFNLSKQSAQTRMRWKVQDTITALIASVSPATSVPADRRAAAKRTKSAVPVIVVRHPYHLRHVFELITQIPDGLSSERRLLELLMGRILRRYGEQLALVKGSNFSFENEAREYFYAGFKMERQIKKINSPDERFAALQSIYTNYFHGRNYYFYALLRKERMAPDNKLFMLYSRAAYFMARVDWSGELLDKPNQRSLPTREDMLFFVQRDKTVLTRYRSDQDFQRQVKSVLEAFPA